MTVSIREATVADIPLIYRLALETFPATYRDIISAGQIAFMMDWMYSAESLRQQMRQGHRFFVGEVDGHPAGYISLRRESAACFHLEKLYVLPAAQGTGLGRRLFERAVAEARGAQPGAERMELNVNRHNRALSFYEHMGMRRDRQGDFDIGNGYFMNDYIMALDL